MTESLRDHIESLLADYENEAILPAEQGDSWDEGRMDAYGLVAQDLREALKAAP